MILKTHLSENLTSRQSPGLQVSVVRAPSLPHPVHVGVHVHVGVGDGVHVVVGVGGRGRVGGHEGVGDGGAVDVDDVGDDDAVVVVEREEPGRQTAGQDQGQEGEEAGRPAAVVVVGVHEFDVAAVSAAAAVGWGAVRLASIDATFAARQVKLGRCLRDEKTILSV